MEIETKNHAGPVLFLDGTLFHSPASGVHYAVREEIHAMAPLLPADRTGIFHSSEDFFIPGRRLSCRCIRTPVWTGSTAGRIFWQQAVLPGLLRRAKAEKLFAPAYTMPLRAGVPVLLHVHDVIALDYPEFCAWKNLLHMRLLLAASIRRAAVCLASSRFVADRMMALLDIPSKKIEVLPLGVRYEYFAEPQPVPFSLPERGYFLFVGNIEPKKNLSLLLKAYASFAEKHPEIPLVIGGRAGWGCGAICRELENWSGAGQVRWLGRVGDRELPGLYQGALALVMPSLCEGFGLPVLEAMAAGTPVLHSDCPALLETAGEAGAGFSRFRPEELAVLMLRLAESPAMAEEMIEAGRQRARRFSWDRWGRAAAEIFLKL